VSYCDPILYQITDNEFLSMSPEDLLRSIKSNTFLDLNLMNERDWEEEFLLRYKIRESDWLSFGNYFGSNIQINILNCHCLFPLFTLYHLPILRLKEFLDLKLVKNDRRLRLSEKTLEALVGLKLINKGNKRKEIMGESVQSNNFKTETLKRVKKNLKELEEETSKKTVTISLKKIYNCFLKHL
jgi:hypothetical protein